MAQVLGGKSYAPPVPPNSGPNVVGLAVAVVLSPVIVPTALVVWGVLKLSPSLSHKFSSKTVPAVMAGVDKQMGDCRRELLKNATGRVLDVGCATGLYLKYLVNPENNVTSVVALEPNTQMHPELRENIRKLSPPFEVEVVSHFLEDVQGDASFDTVILGNVLCEIPDYRAALQEVDRLLKPGGIVVFSEHIAEERGSFLRRLQHSVNWWWVTVSDGCNCNRDSLEAIRGMGWETIHWTYRAGSVPWIRKFVVGVARKSD